MNTSLKITALAAITLALLGPARLFASQPQTCHGTLTTGEPLCAMTPVPSPPVTGSCNVNIDPMTPAQVTINVFSDGVYVFPGFGDAVTVTLDTNESPATFSWQVERSGGCSAQRPYNSLSYVGVANHGGG
jgi:hypothetical protein